MSELMFLREVKRRRSFQREKDQRESPRSFACLLLLPNGYLSACLLTICTPPPALRPRGYARTTFA